MNGKMGRVCLVEQKWNGVENQKAVATARVELEDSRRREHIGSLSSSFPLRAGNP